MSKIKAVFLLALLCIFIFGCQKDDEATDIELEKIESIQTELNNFTKDNILLLDYEHKEGDYVFHFENDKHLKVQEEFIQNIHQNKDRWETEIGFNNDSFITVASIGDSLDFIIEDVTLNPSDRNPLAAVINVHLPISGKVKIVVHGKKEESGTIEHTFKPFEKRHKIPVLGLYQDYENEVDIVFMDEEGNERGQTHTKIQTESISSNKTPSFRVDVKEAHKMEPGVNLVSYPGRTETDTSLPYMVDENGDIRWILILDNDADYKNYIDQIGLQRTEAGTYIAGDMTENRIIEFDVLGHVLNEWDIKSKGYSFHHEVTEAENGNFLITVTKDDAQLEDGTPRKNDFIIELDPNSGSVVKEWDLADILDVSRYPQPDGVTPEEFAPSPGNWGQNNSIAERDGNLLATMRFQGIFSFKPSGSLKWVISPHRQWSEPYKKYLLTPLDKNGDEIKNEEVVLGNEAQEDFDWPWGPHTPVALPNGNILVFDNGYDRHFSYNTSNDAEDYSRIVEYKVDEQNKTVQEVWSYGKSRGKETFSRALSGVQYLHKTGNVLFCPATQTKTTDGRGGHVIELDPNTKNRIFELEITSPGGRAFHRVTRMTIYPSNL